MISSDDLATDEDKLVGAARRAAALRRADRVALYAAIAASGFVAFYIFGYLRRRYDWIGEYAVPMLTFVFGAALVARHVAKVIMYRVDRLGDISLWPWGGGASAAAPAVSEEQWPRSLVIPRLDPTAPANAQRVLTAPLKEGPSAFVSTGGRASTPPDRLPVGVVAMTDAGFAFFPDAEPQAVQAFAEMKAVAWESAKDAFKPLGVLAALGMGEREPYEPTLPQWTVKSVAHDDFFAFGWSELVEVRYANGVVTMIHEAADRPRTAHVFAPNDPRWPVLLMKQRLQYEMTEAIRQNVMRPKADQLAPALLEQFRGIYGDRIEEHSQELYAELERRVGEWMKQSKPALDRPAKEALAPVLPYYAKYPRIVESYPLLFD